MAEFEKGDVVYHSFYGTGKITDTRSIELGGNEQLYYIVKLATGDELMIPVKEDGEDGRLHLPLDPNVVINVLKDTPEELTDDHTMRRKYIQSKISSGKPEQVSEAVRDLTWRAHVLQLHSADKELMNSGKKLLANMLMAEDDVNMKKATQRLDEILTEIIEKWGPRPEDPKSK